MGSPLRHSGGNPFNCSSVETLVGKSSSDGVGDGADRGGTGDEIGALFGRAVQPQERRRDHLRRRIRPADHQRLHVRGDLEIDELAATDLLREEDVGDPRPCRSRADSGPAYR